jgi:aspartate/methionine/tyrosine aminotransferase
MSLSTRGATALNTPNPVLEMFANFYDPVSNPNGIYSLGIAENSLMHDALSKHIHDNFKVPNQALTYGDGAQNLLTTLCRFLNRQLKPLKPIQPSHIALTNGCTTAIEHLTWAFTNPGDHVLLGKPYYGNFLDDVTTRTGAKIAEVGFEGADPLGSECIQKYEEKILEIQKAGGRVGALMLCHPHNPLGRCYPRSVLIDLMRLCQKYQIHLISDEIYALSTFANTLDSNPAPTPFSSILTIDHQDVIDPNLIHVLWGMSKDFGANGLRLGVIISQRNSDLHGALQPVSLFSSISSLTEHVTARILGDGPWVDWYVAENQRLLGERYKYVASWATKNGIEYAPGANAGFFLWVNLGSVYKANHPDVSADDGVGEVVYEKLLEEKIFLAPGFRFGAEQPGWFRIVFTVDQAYLDEGLRRILAALDKKNTAVDGDADGKTLPIR